MPVKEIIMFRDLSHLKAFVIRCDDRRCITISERVPEHEHEEIIQWGRSFEATTIEYLTMPEAKVS